MKISSIADHWQQLSGYLDAALALPAEQRATWIDTVEGITPELRVMLQDLLGVGAQPLRLIGEQPQFDVARTDPVGLPDAGQSIGPYRLISLLGQGGMGSVWLAERLDAQPRRKVALKLPHLGWSPSILARMDRERDILASLEHPNIARLYDAGVDALGRPYMAMEFVDGVPIDRYCEAHASSVRERVRLLRSVADAVAFAHTHLVVHRDLKPSNILVTTSGEVRLLDFGVAKLLQAEAQPDDLTGYAGRALTPDYASPEQIRGEIMGTPTDVYSLGVVSYEILAGVRPYRLREVSHGSLAEAIVRVDPPSASRSAADAERKRQLRGDLDAILSKALKKEPHERYATVAAFGEDLDRFLDNRPTAAAPDRFWYRCGKFIMRNRLQVSAAGVVGIAIVAGSGTALWQARQARLEAERADQVKDFALSIFSDADSDAGADSKTTALDLLMAAEKRVDEDLSSTRPDVAVELMAAIARGLGSQGESQLDLSLITKALDLAEKRLAPDDPQRINANLIYGAALRDNGDSNAAHAVLSEAVARARGLRAKHLLVAGLVLLGTTEMDLGQPKAGIAHLREATQQIPQPGSRTEKIDTLDAWYTLSVALYNAREPGVADAARQALELTNRFFGTRLTAENITARSVLAAGLLQEHKIAAAIAEYTSVLRDTQTYFQPNHLQISVVASGLAMANWEAGDAAAALEAATLQLRVVDAAANGRPTLGQGIANDSVAKMLLLARRREEALSHLDIAVDRLTASVGASNAKTLQVKSLRAATLAELGRMTEAEREFAALPEASFQGEDLAKHRVHMAALRRLQGRPQEAVALAGDAVAALEGSPSVMALAEAYKAQGDALLAAHRPGEAARALQSALDIYVKTELVASARQREAAAALASADDY